MMSIDTQNQFSSLYKDIAARIPSVSDAFFLRDSKRKTVTVVSSQKDLQFEKSRTFINTFAKLEDQFEQVGVPTELNAVHISITSPSGKHVAVIRVKEEGTPNTEYTIEIWDANNVLFTLSTKGKLSWIYNDEWFGGAQWSPDETKIAILAQPFIKAGTSFWSEPNDKTKPEDEDAKKLKGHQFDFVEDWGEGYINKSNSTLYIIDIKEESLKQPKGIPDDLSSVGQVTWSPDSKTIAFAAWKIGPTERRLGIRYCYQRKSFIYSLDLEKEKAIIISNDDYVARSPRFTLDGSAIVYLASGHVITHNTCHQLRLYNIASQKNETVVDIVDTPKDEYSFPGLYVGNLPSRCFLDSNTLVLDSLWQSYKVILKVNIKEKKVERVTTKDYENYAWTITDLHTDGSILAIASSPNSPPRAMFCNDTSSTNWIFTPISLPLSKIDSAKGIAEKLDNIKWDVTTLGTFPNIYQYIHVYPSNVEKPSLVVFAHGGPHSAFSNEYLQVVPYLCLLGYSVILINYRGSLGFGKSLVDGLCGKIGDWDVNDCLDCMEHVIKSGKVNPDKVVYTGGSHGGFLGGHLIAASNRFKAAVLRNPVTNISSMYGVSDIPDWCEAEANSKSIEVMYKFSPMSRLSQISTPTLFLIGELDKRVPTSQGIQMYYALKERGIPTSLKMYPKNGHAISRVEAEADGWVNAALWFYEFLNK